MSYHQLGAGVRAPDSPHYFRSSLLCKYVHYRSSKRNNGRLALRYCSTASRTIQASETFFSAAKRSSSSYDCTGKQTEVLIFLGLTDIRCRMPIARLPNCISLHHSGEKAIGGGKAVGNHCFAIPCTGGFGDETTRPGRTMEDSAFQA